MAEILPSILSPEFFQNSIYLRVRSRELIAHPRLLKQPAVFNFKERLNQTNSLKTYDKEESRPF